jgi:hypothetical protein
MSPRGRKAEDTDVFSALVRVMQRAGPAKLMLGGFGAPRTAYVSALNALRAVTAVHARLAESPRAAVRNLACLDNDLADAVLRMHLLRLARATRARYEHLLADARRSGRTVR